MSLLLLHVAPAQLTLAQVGGLMLLRQPAHLLKDSGGQRPEGQVAHMWGAHAPVVVLEIGKASRAD